MILIFGGGIAGLWTLDECVRRGLACVLLESKALGSGQTVASQGIIHGGVKYMFDGQPSASATAIAEMPGRWRACLRGAAEPDLSTTTLRSEACYLWGTGSLTSRVFLKGADLALRTRPLPVEPHERPAALADVRGPVSRVDEPVIDPVSLVRCLAARHPGRIAWVSPERGPEFARGYDGSLSVTVHSRGTDEPVTFEADCVVFAAGEGNADLRRRAGLPADAMQRRPLHMLMARGDLPELFGHCVGGTKPLATITTAIDSGGRRVWQLGGQVAEDGVRQAPGELIARTRRVVAEVLPGVDLRQAECATYRIDRAEAATATGQRPDDVQTIVEGPFITAWPTKLALAPRLADVIADQLHAAGVTKRDDSATAPFESWPAPPVAAPPWETCTEWFSDR